MRKDKRKKNIGNTNHHIFKQSGLYFQTSLKHIYQEPITRSVQLPYIRIIPVTAFSQTDLFLN